MIGRSSRLSWTQRASISRYIPYPSYAFTIALNYTGLKKDYIKIILSFFENHEYIYVSLRLWGLLRYNPLIHKLWCLGVAANTANRFWKQTNMESNTFCHWHTITHCFPYWYLLHIHTVGKVWTSHKIHKIHSTKPL